MWCTGRVLSWTYSFHALHEQTVWHYSDSSSRSSLLCRRHQVNIGSVRVGNCKVTTVASARNLLVWLQAFDVYSYHKVVFYYLYSIRRIRKYLPRQRTKTLVHAFFTAGIDYCDSFLWWTSWLPINKLQRILNAAASYSLIFQQTRYCHITPLLY